MDGKSFDSWTRKHATLSNRRTMVGWSLAAGVTAALSRVLPTSAQFGGGGNGGGSCTFDVTLTSSLDSSTSVTGSLSVDIGDDGAIDTGSLALSGQSPASVVGHAAGPAIDLLVALADGTTLSLTGVSTGAISRCSGAIVGSLANPDTGQIGTWQTAAGSSSGSGSTAPPASGGQSSSGSGTGSGSGSGNGSGSGSGSGSNGDCSNTPACSPGLIMNSITCQCEEGIACLEDGSSCDSDIRCCSEFCTDGECRSCGGMMCDGKCIDPGLDPENCGGCGNFCDSGTCDGGTCTDGGDGGGGGGCVDIGGACGFSAQCCSGFCDAGTCGFCGTKVCNDMCVDTMTDDNNCGNCNNQCIGTTCQSGSCF